MRSKSKVCLRPRDVKLMLFLSEYGIITNENVKLIYNSEYYFKNRLASLSKGNMVERNYGKVVLGTAGKKYLNESGFGYRNINRDKNYQKRMERISDIACKVHFCGWHFEPSWQCDVNTYTKRGNRYIGVMARERIEYGEEYEDFYKRGYLVYFLHKAITSKEIRYIRKEIERNGSYFKGIVVFIENNELFKYVAKIDASVEDLYVIPYEEKIWDTLKKIKDETYLKNIVYNFFGDKYVKLPSSIFEIYYWKNEEKYTYIVPMPFVDFSKIKWINSMADDFLHPNVEMNVVCNERYIEQIRKSLDGKVEVIWTEI